MAGGWIAALALLVQTIGAATFPDDRVTWKLGDLDPVTYDRQTSVLVVGAVPSADVGCTAPRFTVDVRSGAVLAVHCLVGDEYRLLASGGVQP